MYERRIGLIVPSSNTTMESELNRMAPEDVSIHTARVHLKEVTPEALEKMEKNVKLALRDLMDAEVNVIIFGCTSGSLIKGAKHNLEFSRKMEKSGVPFITTSTAVIEALKALRMDRISVATPYSNEVDKKEREFLEENGIKVLKIRGLGLIKNSEIGKQPPSAAYNLAKSVYAEEGDGIFISCTNFRTMEMIDRLENDVKKPVVTSNQASLWLALKRANVNEDVSGYGRLFKISSTSM